MHRSVLPVLAALAGMVMTLFVAAPADASHDVTPARVSGPTRLHTASAVAELLYPQGTGHAVIAKAGDFPDALAGAPFAGLLDAPILLTDEDQLSEPTRQRLAELEVTSVTLLGGTEAIDASVEQELEDEGYEVGRLRGDTRFATAAAVASEVMQRRDNRANYPGGQRAAFVANGFRFPDALAASAPAAQNEAEIPITLVEQDAIPAATTRFFQEFELDLAIIVGGTAAVSEQVRQQFEDMGVTTTRIDGATRVDTATSVAAFAREFLGFDADTFLLTRGDAFPDALAAGPLGGASNDPILLTRDPDTLSQETADYLADACPEVQVVRAVGGEAAITTATLNDAEAAAQSCHPGDGQDGGDEQGQSFIVAPQQPREGQVGDQLTFEVGARYDGQDFTGPVDVALVPCENADIIGSGRDTFADADGDGHADDLGATDTGFADIVAINGETVTPEPDIVRDVGPDEDGILDMTLSSDGQDCVVLVVWDDVGDDGAFDLDEQDTPAEPYGVGKASWS